MKYKYIIFLLLLICTPLHAFDWNSEKVTIISFEPKGAVLLKDNNNCIFQIQNPQNINEDRLNRILALVGIFSKWEKIKLSKLDFVLGKNKIRAVVIPDTIKYQGIILDKYIASGMMFFEKDGILSYNFRIFKEMLFIKIKGNYVNEDLFLEDIAKAVSESQLHIKQNDPKYLIQKIHELEKEMRRMKSETENLRQALVDLHKTTFCTNQECADRVPDDKIISSDRYPQDIVRKVKEQLTDNGYYHEEINGKWGYLTYKALMRFQDDIPLLIKNGNLDDITNIVLANKNLQNIKHFEEEFMLFKDIPGLDKVEKYRLIMEIEMALHNKGYNPGAVDGNRDLKDLRELIKFQHDNGLEVSGKPDKKTLERLFDSDIESISAGIKQDIKVPPDLAVSIQNTLFIKGYETGRIDGVWGRHTITTIAEFQINEKIRVTGRPDLETLTKLFDGDIYNYIEKVQNCLQQRGYNPGKTDGKWGELTEKAIKSFQEDHLLEITGRIDNKTKEYLFY